MSDFVPRNNFHELWDEILDIHWTYLETEESIIKLEKRKKLEDCLKEYLCIVHPERKFFLPDTAKVLKKSVRDLENFNAQKGITAFESISQYANNLYSKPWRKEFRILKLYSGFYQHEVKSNLIDAEILFEAMGYRRLSEDTLILDGPICQDQVANVSRDAMTAYVELQIIKHIYTGLNAIGINCSWLDIYRYREKHTGGTSQAVKSLANSFGEKRLSARQNLLMGDNYGYIDVEPPANYFATNTEFCPANCQCSTFKQDSLMSRQRTITRANNGFCCVPEHQTPSLTATNLAYNNMSYPAQRHYQYNSQHQHHHHQPRMAAENDAVLLPHMPHSRSLDHYTGSQNQQVLLPHRHSFDHQQQGCTAQHQYQNSQQQQQQQFKQQQQNYYQHLNKVQQNLYESPYDYIDGNSLGGGSSTISYAAVAANAGAGGNCNLNPSSAYSHAYNVSGNRFPLPSNISNQLFYDKAHSNNYHDLQEPAYAHIGDQNVYSITKQPENFASIYNNSRDFLQRQHSCQPEKLINFDNHASIQQQFDPLHQYRPNYEISNHLLDKQLNLRNALENSTGQQLSGPGKPLTNDDTYVYAKPTPKEKRKQNTLNARKYPCNSGDTTDISYDSANDDLGNVMTSTDTERNHQSSPTQSTKNQDGVGSAELWSNVYQNVEKKGSSRDSGERNDFLVQSLDLDSMNINNETLYYQNSLTEKRRSLLAGNDKKTTIQQQLEAKPKSRTFENAKYLSKTNSKSETVSISSSANGTQKQKSSLDKNTKKIKSTPKQTHLTSKPNASSIHNTKTQAKSNDNKTSSKTVNNNNKDFNVNPGNGSAQHKKLSSSADIINTTKKAPPVASTQIIIDNEWSCTFCTFLNPNSKRVCEICCHSKDFKGDSTSSSAGGTTTMAHNTPTCA